MSLQKFIIYLSLLASLAPTFALSAPDEPVDPRGTKRTNSQHDDEEDADKADDPDYAPSEESDDEDDFYAKRHRPGWQKGRREAVADRFRSPGQGGLKGRVRCGICGRPVPETPGALHVDHYAEDWVRREERLVESPPYQAAAGSPIRQRTMRSGAFNASPLRPAHAACNCARSGRTPSGRQREQVERARMAALGAGGALMGAAAAQALQGALGGGAAAAGGIRGSLMQRFPGGGCGGGCSRD
ncbi:MAG: hypothetical protein HYW48_01475 [Deltaproteobacteria bacterium]|nr:hypothetical protein [Deltaproteobacteria bacterium]